MIMSTGLIVEVGFKDIRVEETPIYVRLSKKHICLPVKQGKFKQKKVKMWEESRCFL